MAGSRSGSAPPRRRPRGGEVLKDLVLTCAALLGIVAVGWLVYSHHSGATIVVLKTGSMAPDMPQGSAAISAPVAADRLEVGDVVTVRIDDASPLVTHRIVEIRAVDGRGGQRSLVLQGDDNDTPDVFPYTVDRALRVVHAVPNGGYVLAALRAPIVLGGVVLLIGLLVMWAFWPAPLAEIEAELTTSGRADA